MDMIVLAIICGILANELFAWGPRFSDLLLKIAVKRMSPKLKDRMREEWQAHLDTLPGGLSKLGAAASFLLSTFWGFRRYREDETPIEIEERIALEVAFALNQERQRQYANRRLYNTATSSYVTLDDLARMIKDGGDFVACDAKTGEDITRSVLTQIIVEREQKGQNLLPISFLRQLIALEEATFDSRSAGKLCHHKTCGSIDPSDDA